MGGGTFMLIGLSGSFGMKIEEKPLTIVAPAPDSGNPEISWLNAVNCVWSDSMKKGLSILDSIRSSPSRNDPSFLWEYLKITSQCLLPVEGKGNDSLTIFLPPSIQKEASTYLGPDDVRPDKMEWRINERPAEGPLASTFSLSAALDLVPAPSLKFPPLKEIAVPALNIAVDARIAADIPLPPVPDPFSQKSKMEMRVLIAPGKANISITDYMNSIISNRYDEVWKSGDLARLGAVAVRCRERSVFRNVPGNYYAYVAFDARIFSDHAQMRLEPLSKTIRKEDIPARYLIAMRSSEAVEKKAEQILQNVLERFEQRVN
jgi:hypothetical protein